MRSPKTSLPEQPCFCVSILPLPARALIYAFTKGHRPLTRSIVSFCVGTSTSLGTGQSVFSNLLLNKLPTVAPGVEPITVINTGATDIRTVFPADAVPGIIEAYLYALRAVFAVVIAYAGVAVMFAAGSKWQRLNLKG